MKTTKKSETKKDGLFLELDGRVNLLERKNGRTRRDALDGDTILRCILLVLEQALDSYPVKSVKTTKSKGQINGQSNTKPDRVGN